MYINDLKLKRVAHNIVAVSITTLRSMLILRRKLAITDCNEIFDFRLTPFSVNRHFFEELNANRNWIHNALLFIWLEPDKQKCDILPNHTDVHTVGPNQNFYLWQGACIKQVSIKNGLYSINYCSSLHIKEYEQGKQNLQCSRLYKENGRDIYVA